MSKNLTNTLFFFAVTLIFIVTGCGSSGSSTASLATNAAQSKVIGVASLGTTATSTVTVKDSSVPSQEKTAALSSNGSYTADVSGLKAPFILKTSGTDETGDNLMLYSVSTNGGRANINQISDLAVAAAASMDTNAAGREMAYSWSNNNDDNRTNADNFDRVINSLRTVLAPLFALYQVSGNPITEEDGGEHDGEHDNSRLSAMLRDVRIVVTKGTVIVTNRQTNDVIFSGPLNDLASGTFHPENMPAGPGGSTTCTYTYSDWGVCQSDNTQTRTMLTSSPSGCTGTPVLSQACADVPPTSSACTSFTYSAWGACQSDNTQTRTVLTSSPAGCTGGSPSLSQSCTYVPPVTLCTSFTYSAWGTCQSDSTQTRSVLTSSPTGCTGGTPVLSQSCTYVPPVTPCTSFTYSAWGACQSNSTQSRTVLTSSPTGCTGGTPVLSQSCTYVPPVTPCTSFTYSAWGACQSNSTQTRTTLTSSRTGCTGGTPVMQQSCTYVPPSTVTLANVTSSCTGCHGLTVNTTVFKTGGYTVSNRSSSSWLSTVNSMVGLVPHWRLARPPRIMRISWLVFLDGMAI